jgi:4-amino-4-deoxy-L-arabinose transferase-like glycosyltransferase
MSPDEFNNPPPGEPIENKEFENQDHARENGLHQRTIHVQITADLPEGTCLKVTLEAIQGVDTVASRESVTIGLGRKGEATAYQTQSGSEPASGLKAYTHEIKKKIKEVAANIQEWIRFSLSPPPQLFQIKKMRIFLTGISLIIVSQFVILQKEPIAGFFGVSEKLNSLFRIDVPNLDNALLAMCGFLLGTVLIFLSIRTTPIADLTFPALILDRNLLKSKFPTLAKFLFLPTATFGLLIWQLATGNYRTYFVYIWILSIVSAAIAAFLIDRWHQVTIKLQIQRSDIFAISALLLVGFLVGTYQLQKLPSSIMGDEGAFWNTASAIAEKEYRPDFFGFGVYSYPIAGSIYQAWFIKIFGSTLWSWRFASVFIAVLAVIPTYLLARELYSRRIALLSGGIMVLTPYFIAFERLGYNNSQAILPTALTLYLLYAGLRRNSLFYLYLGGVIAGFGFYTYPAARLGFISALLFLIVLLFSQIAHGIRLKMATRQVSSTVENKPLKSTLILAIAFILGWVVTTVLHLGYGYAVSPENLSHKTAESFFANIDYANALFRKEELFRDYPPIEIGYEQLFYRPDLYARLLTRGIIRSFLVFHHDQLITEHFISGPLTGPWAPCFYLLGLILTIAGMRQVNNRLLAIWFFMGLLLLSIINTFPPRHQHLVSIIPSMSILIALGIVLVADTFSHFVRKRRALLSGIMAVICFYMLACTNLYNYFITVQDQYVPNFENRISFAALELDEPTEMVLIYDNPEKKEFIPWIIKNIPTNANYQTIAYDEITHFKIDEARRIIFFYEGEDQEDVLRALKSAIGEIINPTYYHNREGNIIGASYTKAESSDSTTTLHLDGLGFVATFCTILFVLLCISGAVIFESMRGQIKQTRNQIRSYPNHPSGEMQNTHKEMEL